MSNLPNPKSSAITSPPLIVTPSNQLPPQNVIHADAEMQIPWYEMPDWWIAVFTAALFIATSGLWYFTARMWKGADNQRRDNRRAIFASLAAARAARKSADVARDEFVATHRPDFKIHSIKLLEPAKDSLPSEQPICAQFYIINAGSGAGTIISSSVMLEYAHPVTKIWTERPMMNEVITFGRYLVGQADEVTVESDFGSGAIHWSDQSLISFVDTTLPQLYFYGWILYGDDRNGRRTCYFCRVYDTVTDTFRLIDDPDANATY